MGSKIHFRIRKFEKNFFLDVPRYPGSYLIFIFFFFIAIYFRANNSNERLRGARRVLYVLNIRLAFDTKFNAEGLSGRICYRRVTVASGVRAGVYLRA